MNLACISSPAWLVGSYSSSTGCRALAVSCITAMSHFHLHLCLVAAFQKSGGDCRGGVVLTLSCVGTVVVVVVVVSAEGK
jgi:hypothetical protein